MRRPRWIALGLVMLLTAGCGGDGRSVEVDPPLMANVAREAPATNAPVDATVDGLTRFGYDLYREVAGSGAGPGNNIVVSPLCVGYAFALARAGARGETAAQLDRVFGFPDGLHDALNAMTRQIVTVDGPPGPRPSRTPGVILPPTVSIASGLFLQRGFEVGEPFLRTLAAKHGAGVRPVDFAAGDSAKRTIDGWARIQTADRIEEVFKELRPDTKVVLANAVYLRADWTDPFRDIGKEPFTRADGTAVPAEMMRRTGEARYLATRSWQAVELPYAHSDLAMWVIVPAGRAAPDGLLAPDTLDAIAAGLAPTPLGLVMPHWDFETRPQLVEALRAMGLTDPFTMAADFSGIAPGLFIGDAVHAANITVDETGTEAAAVAAIAMPESAPAQPEIEVRADRPFAFAIVHLPTRAPLFIGRVADPTAMG
jgi:serine protease inhibitor